MRGGGEVEPPTNFSKRGHLTGSQFLERGCWETGGSGWGCSFYIKNKLKSQVFSDKKMFISKNAFFCYN